MLFQYWCDAFSLFRDLSVGINSNAQLASDNDRVFDDLWRKDNVPTVLNNPYSESEQVNRDQPLPHTLILPDRFLFLSRREEGIFYYKQNWEKEWKYSILRTCRLIDARSKLRWMNRRFNRLVIYYHIWMILFSLFCLQWCLIALHFLWLWQVVFSVFFYFILLFFLNMYFFTSQLILYPDSRQITSWSFL